MLIQRNNLTNTVILGTSNLTEIFRKLSSTTSIVQILYCPQAGNSLILWLSRSLTFSCLRSYRFNLLSQLLSLSDCFILTGSACQGICYTSCHSTRSSYTYPTHSTNSCLCYTCTSTFQSGSVFVKGLLDTYVSSHSTQGIPCDFSSCLTSSSLCQITRNRGNASHFLGSLQGT